MKWWIYLIVYLISQVAGVLTGIILSLCFHTDSLSILLISLLTANLLSILLFLLIRPARRIRANKFLRLNVITFLMSIPCIVLVNLLMEYLPELPNSFDNMLIERLMKTPIGVISIALLAPIAEEFMFRGGILGSMFKTYEFAGHDVSDRGHWRYIVWSAIIFSVAHFNPSQMIAALLIGLLLGWSYWKTGSLLAPCLIHILNNSAATGLSLIYDDPDVTLSSVCGDAWGLVVIVCIAVVWLGVCIQAARKIQ